MDHLLSLLTDPATWAALPALTAMKVVPGIDKLIFVFSIDSSITAVAMTAHIPIMMLAVNIAVGAMMLALRYRVSPE